MTSNTSEHTHYTQLRTHLRDTSERAGRFSCGGGLGGDRHSGGREAGKRTCICIVQQAREPFVRELMPLAPRSQHCNIPPSERDAGAL